MSANEPKSGPATDDAQSVPGAIEIHVAPTNVVTTKSSAIPWTRLAALPDFALAGAALLTWIAPQILGLDWVKWLLMLLMFEFLALHATGFFSMIAFADGRRSSRGVILLVLAAFYTFFAGTMSALLGQWSPLIMLWLLALKHAGHILTQPDERAKQVAMVMWGLSLGAYLGALLITTITPLPELGITEAVRKTIAIPGRGLWVDHPQRALAGCALYFAGVGLLQFFGVAEKLASRNIFRTTRHRG